MSKASRLTVVASVTQQSRQRVLLL